VAGVVVVVFLVDGCGGVVFGLPVVVVGVVRLIGIRSPVDTTLQY